jgi:hypothetical protein
MAQPEDSLFEYPKLTPGKNCLRLLKININDNDDPTDAVICELQSFVLGECPPYKALSYTWETLSVKIMFSRLPLFRAITVMKIP